VQQLAALTEAAADSLGALEPEVDAAARRVRRLLRAKLEELKAVPLRGGGAGGRPTRASESSSGGLRAQPHSRVTLLQVPCRLYC
jgi:hypothetical protein